MLPLKTRRRQGAVSNSVCPQSMPCPIAPFIESFECVISWSKGVLQHNGIHGGRCITVCSIDSKGQFVGFCWVNKAMERASYPTFYRTNHLDQMKGRGMGSGGMAVLAPWPHR